MVYTILWMAVSTYYLFSSITSESGWTTLVMSIVGWMLCVSLIRSHISSISIFQSTPLWGYRNVQVHKKNQNDKPDRSMSGIRKYTLLITTTDNTSKEFSEFVIETILQYNGYFLRTQLDYVMAYWDYESGHEIGCDCEMMACRATMDISQRYKNAKSVVMSGPCKFGVVQGKLSIGGETLNYAAQLLKLNELLDGKILVAGLSQRTTRQLDMSQKTVVQFSGTSSSTTVSELLGLANSPRPVKTEPSSPTTPVDSYSKKFRPPELSLPPNWKYIGWSSYISASPPASPKVLKVQRGKEAVEKLRKQVKSPALIPLKNSGEFWKKSTMNRRAYSFDISMINTSPYKTTSPNRRPISPAFHPSVSLVANPTHLKLPEAVNVTINTVSSNGSSFEETTSDILMDRPKPVVSVFEDSERNTWTVSSNHLGKGSFGNVHLGMDSKGQLVAVKQMKMKHGDEKLMEVMIKEIALLAQFHHRHIVSYLASAFVVNTFMIVMEYVSGGTLANIIADFHHLSLPVAACYSMDIVKGLNYLHHNDICHRDLKPHNVLVERNGLCKLADFGTSGKLEDLCCGGTMFYSAPEILTKGQCSKASDIWSVGVIIAQMITGELPFESSQSNCPIKQIYAFTASNFAIGNLHSLPSLESAALVKACLEMDPIKRPSVDQIQNYNFFNNHLEFIQERGRQLSSNTAGISSSSITSSRASTLRSAFTEVTPPQSPWETVSNLRRSRSSSAVDATPPQSPWFQERPPRYRYSPLLASSAAPPQPPSLCL